MTGAEMNDDFIQNRGSLTIPSNTKVSLLIDQEYETVGYPEMVVSGGKDSKIQAMYAENLIIKNHSPKGNRNDIEDKKLVGIKDVFIPDGSSNRLFKPTYLRTFRFIQLDIETKKEPLIIEKYYQVTCNTPIELKAKFEIDNADLDWMMNAGWRTVSICAQDILVSDAVYEQMQYTGDSLVHNPYAAHPFGRRPFDSKLAHSVRSVAHSRRAFIRKLPKSLSSYHSILLAALNAYRVIDPR